MRRLSPLVAALLLQLPDLLERALEILDMARGFALLQGKILGDAFLDGGTAQGGPHVARAGHRIERHTGMGLRIAIQL